jgi:hypothetical protein
MPQEDGPGIERQGAKYNSQGQAMKERRPWMVGTSKIALKGRNRIPNSHAVETKLHRKSETLPDYCALSGLHDQSCLTRGDAPSSLAPGYHISRPWRFNFLHGSASNLVDSSDVIFLSANSASTRATSPGSCDQRSTLLRHAAQLHTRRERVDVVLLSLLY